MTELWEPQIDQDYYYESTSDHSPLTPLGRDAVPAGTVASRILQLQNLANCLAPNRRRSPVDRDPDNSRTGWGRRIRQRFGQPASRSSKPDQEVQEEPKHSFLGLNTQRINHMEEHALVDGRTKWDQTTGLHGQLQPRGLGTRVQYEATSPWGFLPKSISSKNLKQDHNYHEQGTRVQSQPGDQHKGKKQVSLHSGSSEHDGMGRTSILPESTVQTTDKSKQLPALLQQNKSLPSAWTSAETTSTMRKSVRDLYYHYGIQRPAGLVSSENDIFDIGEMPQHSGQQRYCHICSWVNSLGARICRCGHTLCDRCDILLSEAIISSDGSAECTTCVPDDEGGNLCVSTHVGQSSNREPPIQAHRQKQNPKHKEKQGFSQDESRQTEGAEAQNCVRIATCSIVGPLVPTYSLSVPPQAMRVIPSYDPYTSHSHHHRRKSHYQNISHSLSSSESIGGTRDCDRSDCRATNQDYVPNRHSMSSTRRRRRYTEETDSGYIAGTSHLEDLDVSQKKQVLKSRLENQVDIHNTQIEGQLPLYNGASSYLQSKIPCDRVGQTADQNFDQERMALLQCEIKGQDEVEHARSHEQSHPKLREDDTPTTKTSFLERAHSSGQVRDNNSEPGSLPIDSGITQVALPELLPLDATRQSLTTVAASESEMKLESPDWSNADTAILSKQMPVQETSVNPKSECKSESYEVPSNLPKQETPVKVVSQSTETRCRADSQADLFAETLPSASTQPSGDLSPRKFKPASRRLSAFFKLQEQNIVSLLNKRLQEHQEELKRIERRRDDQASAAAERLSPDQRQCHDVNRVSRERQQLEEIDLAKITEHDPVTSKKQRSDEVSKDMMMSHQDQIQGLSSPLVYGNLRKEEQEMEHDCIWRRRAMRNAAEFAQDSNTFGTPDAIKAREQEAKDVGINGIMVVIHLEGREDVVIRADLSQGLRGWQAS